MTMDYNAELAEQALNQFEKPDGNPLFEHASETLRLMYTLDVHNYVTFNASRKKEDLVTLFSSSTPEAVNSLVLAEGPDAPFGGEWFMKVTLGKNVKFAADAKILAHGGIAVGDNALIGEQAQLVTVGHPMHPRQRHLILIGPLAVAEGAVVGSGAIVINPGLADTVTVGRHSVVLPDAIINRTVPDYTVVGGVNKVLLEGKEYFTEDTTSVVLSKRLNEQGLAALKEKAKALGLDVPDDVTKKITKPLPAGVRTIDHNVTKDLTALGKFFPKASEEVIRMGLFFPPIHLMGSGDIKLGNNILFNTSSMLDVDGEFEIGDGSFLAPEAEIHAPAGSKVILGKKVWLGAKVKVSAKPGQTITIGDGSVLAAGAEVKESVPEMSVVVGEGKIADTLTDKSLYPIKDTLNNFDIYETQRLKLREYIAGLSITEVKQLLSKNCTRPTNPSRVTALGKKI